MKYPPLPWPEDVPRREMPKPFWADGLVVAAFVGTLAPIVMRLEADENAVHFRHLIGALHPSDPPVCPGCGKRIRS